MKTHLLTFLVIASMSSFAQISITSADYHLPVTPDTAYLRVVAGGSSAVTPGMAQTWDLSGIFAGSNYEFSMDAVTSPNFPNSMGQVNTPVTLVSGLTLTDFYNYYSISTSGYFQDGFEMLGAGYSLQNITGDVADSIFTVDTVQTLNIPIVQFPLALGTNWTYSTRVWIPMEVTIEQFQWSRELISLSQSVTAHDTAVGYGTVILPGGKSASVLLVHEYALRVDSVMFNGTPMDPFTAQQIGLPQNDTSRIHKWSMYTKYLNSPVYEYAVVDGAQGQPYFNRSPSLSSPESELESVFVVFPNPARDEIRVMSDSPSSVKLLSITGQLVTEVGVESWNSGIVKIDVSGIAAGVYVLQMGDRATKVTVE